MGLESGLRSQRIEYVAETTEGVAPTDPAWNLFSDTVQSFTATPGVEIAMRRGLGDVDVSEFVPGREEHSVGIVYDLQQAVSADALNDFWSRAADGQSQNTHTIVQREDKVGTAGVADGGQRIYTVALGAYPSSATLSGDPGSTAAVEVELTYEAEKVRSFKIDQPSSGTTLTIESTDAADTTQSVTIEDEGAGTSESNTLTGTTQVTTTASFSDIDAIHLDAETVGNVLVKDGSGNTLATLYGTDAYDGAEGDLGVPLLGSGSHASAIGSAFENFLGDTVERPGGTDIGENLNSVSASVDNNLEVVPTNLRRPKIEAGIRVIEVEAVVIGESESHEAMINHLQATENDIVWTLTNSTLTFANAVLTSPGDRTYESEGAVMQLNNTFTADGLTIA